VHDVLEVAGYLISNSSSVASFAALEGAKQSMQAISLIWKRSFVIDSEILNYRKIGEPLV